MIDQMRELISSLEKLAEGLVLTYEGMDELVDKEESRQDELEDRPVIEEPDPQRLRMWLEDLAELANGGSGWRDANGRSVTLEQLTEFLKQWET